jgi:hypothetical protein
MPSLPGRSALQQQSPIASKLGIDRFMADLR